MMRSKVLLSSGLALLAALVVTSEAGVATAQMGARPWRGRPDRPPVMALPAGTGRLRNAAKGMCLDVAGWAAKGDGNVLLWECNDDPDQVWAFTPSGELHDALTGTCLDIAGYDGAQGANVGIYRCENLDDQRWTLAPRGRGTFEVRSNKRGLCLDVNGKAGNRGDNVMIWACNDGVDQLWSWEPYAVRAAPAPVRPTGPNPYPRHPATTPELEAPRPAPPPPPPPPPSRESRRAWRPMADEPFRALINAVQHEAFAENQLNVVREAAQRNNFRVAQIKALIDLVSFSATKLGVLEACAPRIVDGENAFMVFEAFTFSADKDRAREILRRNGL